MTNLPCGCYVIQSPYVGVSYYVYIYAHVYIGIPLEGSFSGPPKPRGIVQHQCYNSAPKKQRDCPPVQPVQTNVEQLRTRSRALLEDIGQTLDRTGCGSMAYPDLPMEFPCGLVYLSVRICIMEAKKELCRKVQDVHFKPGSR